MESHDEYGGRDAGSEDDERDGRSVSACRCLHLLLFNARNRRNPFKIVFFPYSSPLPWLPVIDIKNNSGINNAYNSVVRLPCYERKRDSR